MSGRIIKCSMEEVKHEGTHEDGVTLLCVCSTRKKPTLLDFVSGGVMLYEMSCGRYLSTLG